MATQSKQPGVRSKTKHDARYLKGLNHCLLKLHFVCVSSTCSLPQNEQGRVDIDSVICPAPHFKSRYFDQMPKHHELRLKVENITMEGSKVVAKNLFLNDEYQLHYAKQNSTD